MPDDTSPVPTSIGYASEIKSLTGLRGIAAMVVVIYHVFKNTWIARYTQNGYLAVDVFFVLSGFVMMLTYGQSFEVNPTLRRYVSFLWARLAGSVRLSVCKTFVVWGVAVIGLYLADCLSGKPVSAVDGCSLV